MGLDAIAQHNTPLLSALQNCAIRSTAAFHTPGHKRGKGIDPALQTLMGDRVFQSDLPELPELDNLFAPSGVIQAAQALAAQAFGAEQTWFLTNGSTSGIIAAILATCNPGEKIILPRHVHQSVISGLVLSGATPILVQPEYDSRLDLAHCVAPAMIATALSHHPDAKAVMIVSPTYLGVCGDVAAIAQLCHQRNIPLLVDEAHGAHFSFHPDLPTSALQAGADVVVQSTHKTLSALTQAAMLHTQADLIDRDRLTRALSLVQSTSPNYLLLASLDAARQQMALHGKELMTQTLHLADDARSRLAQIPELSILTPQPSPTPGFFALDRTRLTVTISNLGIDGFTADEWLNHQCGVIAELPTLNHLTFIITLGNTQTDIDRLVQGFQWLVESKSFVIRHSSFEYKGPMTIDQGHSSSPPTPSPLSPRKAFFAQTETIPIQEAIDRISAELICPYPPGIPILVPGEVITRDAIATLQNLLASGAVLSGGADLTLETIKVIQQ
ncbi:MAG: aminotransferase class I/II-fold pyridoxal phosphate-dependent enzyme [Leptolyngbyaceae cyanobacterium bins.302]|nr:aminotransferase class I/II-fold pyridoxal phosphate-dependent enzyme [Leptolyngbyaceae cyanobacterium bins.302]